MAWKTKQLETPDSANCASTPRRPQPKAVIQINHGMAEHAARYERLQTPSLRQATPSSRMTIAATATPRPGSAQGFFAKKDGLGRKSSPMSMSSTPKSATRHPDTPIVCFGHSMGAIVALNYAMQHPTGSTHSRPGTSASMPAPCWRSIARLLKTERFFKGSDVPSRIAPKLTFEAWNKTFAPTRTDFDWLSRDEAEVDKYVADPLCGFPR